MEKPKGFKSNKKHYAVYYVGHGDGCYAKDYCNVFLGETWAVSPEKACSNVRYRMRDDKYPHGGYGYDSIGDRCEEGSVFFEFEARLID